MLRGSGTRCAIVTFMMVYRSQARRESTRRRLRDLIDVVERWPAVPSHDQVTTALIELGELESGVADARQPERDDLTEVTQEWRGATWCAADELWAALGHGRTPSTNPISLIECLHRLETLPLPQFIERRVSEGFAYYGLSPDMYVDATLRLLDARTPRPALVIGIRSIGTTLSAVVAAGLQRHGVEVQSVTVRPRGHPFNRQLRCGHRLLDRWLRAAGAGAEIVVVDEGPGLSGSSFVSVVRLLTQIGVPLDAIVLMPGWDPEPSRLRSHDARTWWPRLRKVPTSFERTIDPRQLIASPPTSIVDVGAGAWREHVLPSPAEYPPVHPNHERRKYLARHDRAAAAAAETSLMLKWAGLGAYGGDHRGRADALAAHRWGLPTLGLARGFVTMPFLRAAPLSVADVDTPLIERLARYLAWRGLDDPTGQDVDAAPLIEMVHVNVAEALGEDALIARVDLERLADVARTRPAVRLDARMFPHEWLRPADGLPCAVKTDGVEHGDDHFFPGPTDPAWDVAGTAIEFELEHARHERLVDSYARLAGDREIRERLPFFRLAYLAYRVGYTTLAVETLGATPDGARFAAARRRYVALLRAAWQRASHSRSL